MHFYFYASYNEWNVCMRTGTFHIWKKSLSVIKDRQICFLFPSNCKSQHYTKEQTKKFCILNACRPTWMYQSHVSKCILKIFPFFFFSQRKVQKGKLSSFHVSAWDDNDLCNYYRNLSGSMELFITKGYFSVIHLLVLITYQKTKSRILYANICTTACLTLPLKNVKRCKIHKIYGGFRM